MVASVAVDPGTVVVVTVILPVVVVDPSVVVPPLTVVVPGRVVVGNPVVIAWVGVVTSTGGVGLPVISSAVVVVAMIGAEFEIQ